jgi:hypothetical protein
MAYSDKYTTLTSTWKFWILALCVWILCCFVVERIQVRALAAAKEKEARRYVEAAEARRYAEAKATVEEKSVVL